MNAAKYPTWDWRKAAAKAMHAAQEARASTPATSAPRSDGAIVADLRAELADVRMSNRVRARVNALLDEINQRSE